MKKYFILMIIMNFTVTYLYAENNFIIPKLIKAPVIDGIVNNGEWDSSLLIEKYYQIAPGYNIEPSEKTEISVGYDDKCIYFLAKCFMTDKTKMRALHCRRDDISISDNVLIALDTFHSNDKAYYIAANAFGEQSDGIFTDEYDSSVDFLFYSQGKITDFGYVVEFALPFKSIKYNSGQNLQWGIFIKRIIVDKNEEIGIFPISRSALNYFDNYGSFSFHSLPHQQNLKIIPASIESYSKDEDKINHVKNVKLKFEPELNIFYEPITNLSLTATINPDFSIIEADALNIEINNRFPLCYPEKRPFFMEKTNLFDVPINIFHTRKIVDPLWSSKLSGAFDKYSAYALVAIDEDVPGARFYTGNNEFAKTFFGFSSVYRQLGNSDSHFRAAGSIRKFQDYYNAVFHFDDKIRFTRNLYMRNQIVSTLNETLFNKQEKGFGYYFDFTFKNEHWLSRLSTKAVSPDFTADLGFIPEKDFRIYYNYNCFYIYSKDDKKTLQYFELGVKEWVKYYYDHSKMFEWYLDVFTGFEFKKNIGIYFGREDQYLFYGAQDNMSHNWWVEASFDPFRIFGGNVKILNGISLWYDPSNPISEDYLESTISINIRPTSKIDIKLTTIGEDLTDIYHAQTYELWTKYQFNKNFWIRGIFQLTQWEIELMNEKFTGINFYPLFVYKLNANTAIYLGATSVENKYKESRLTIDYTKNLKYFLKVSYAFDVN